MDYTTTITWHTKFPKAPGYPDKPEDMIKGGIDAPLTTSCMLLIKVWNEFGDRFIKLEPDVEFNFDGTWSILSPDGISIPVTERYSPEWSQLMAWGEYHMSGDVTAKICDASNLENYGITKRDFRSLNF